jgi:hypothetical protein
LLLFQRICCYRLSLEKKYRLLALISFLLIPVVGMIGFGIYALIDPEIAVKTTDYAANFRRLYQLKTMILYLVFFSCTGFWILTCLFTIKAKQRSLGWLPLAIFGPFGFVFLFILKSGAQSEEPAPSTPPFRPLLELLFFLSALFIAHYAVVLKNWLFANLEAARTGTTTAQIFQIQSSSSGMYAFGETVETAFLFALLYLLRPLAAHIYQRLKKSN